MSFSAPKRVHSSVVPVSLMLYTRRRRIFGRVLLLRVRNYCILLLCGAENPDGGDEAFGRRHMYPLTKSSELLLMALRVAVANKLGPQWQRPHGSFVMYFNAIFCIRSSFPYMDHSLTSVDNL